VELRDATEETVALHRLTTNYSRMVLTQVESRHPLRRTYTEIAQEIPLPLGAPGKVLLAWLDEGQREELLAQPLASATERTVTSASALRSEIADVRARGFAISVEERLPGISTLTVPVHGRSSSVIAALSVSGPSTRLSPRRLRSFAVPAIEAASRISKSMGY